LTAEIRNLPLQFGALTYVKPYPRGWTFDCE